MNMLSNIALYPNLAYVGTACKVLARFNTDPTAANEMRPFLDTCGVDALT